MLEYNPPYTKSPYESISKIITTLKQILFEIWRKKDGSGMPQNSPEIL